MRAAAKPSHDAPPRSLMSAQTQQFFVRFDGSVDQHASRLTVVRDGVVVRELRPRLGAQPNTLYVAAGSLPPGAYRLEWSAMPMRGGATVQGSIDFTVR
jgi:methionine-rich copper-binding protein CopC